MLIESSDFMKMNILNQKNFAKKETRNDEPQCLEDKEQDLGL